MWIVDDSMEDEVVVKELSVFEYDFEGNSRKSED